MVLFVWKEALYVGIQISPYRSANLYNTKFIDILNISVEIYHNEPACTLSFVHIVLKFLKCFLAHQSHCPFDYATIIGKSLREPSALRKEKNFSINQHLGEFSMIK